MIPRTHSVNVLVRLYDIFTSIWHFGCGSPQCSHFMILHSHAVVMCSRRFFLCTVMSQFMFKQRTILQEQVPKCFCYTNKSTTCLVSTSVTVKVNTIIMLKSIPLHFERRHLAPEVRGGGRGGGGEGQ